MIPSYSRRCAHAECCWKIFIRPLTAANPPIIPRDRLHEFLNDVFHNFKEIHTHQRRLLDRLHEIQREEHPQIRSITAPVFDAALNWRDAYMEYIPNHPIATYRVDEELASNLLFKTFVEVGCPFCQKDPYSFIYHSNVPDIRMRRS